jgi:hypothetical protein
MKKTTLLTIILASSSLFLQAQQGFKWQGLAQDVSGNPVNQAVTLTFSILQNNNTIYIETHTPILPNNGQLTATVGEGTATQGNFSNIDWSLGDYSLNVKMIVGSGAIVDMGTSAISPVPLALAVPRSFLSTDGRFVGTVDLKSNGEGFFEIVGSDSGSEWTISTKTFSSSFEDIFNNITLVSGTMREYYLGVNFDVETDLDSGPGIPNMCLYDDTISVADLPQIALDYLAANYSGLTIVTVTIKNNGHFSVRLSNDAVVTFNQDGDHPDECYEGNNCQASLLVRFNFPEIQTLGHQSEIPISWDHDVVGQTKWLKVPSPQIQLPNSTNLEWRLESGLSANCSGKDIRINNIVLAAIDKTSGSQPAINISNAVGTIITPAYSIGGLNGKISISSTLVNVSGALHASSVSTGALQSSSISTGGITAQGVINANGGLTIPGITIINGNMGIGTTSPTEKLDVNGRIKTKVLEITGADIIEKVNSNQPLVPGEVVVWDVSKHNSIIKSMIAYDNLVFGVVSGAGNIPHGIELTAPGILDGNVNVAIAGRVYVKTTGKVKPGDLLTTSNIPGKAMRSSDFFRRSGTIIGKALSTPDENGLVLLLVNLQ